MKRCPQCEFIYEDDQSVCDMDGRLLIFDPATMSIDDTVEIAPRSKSRWKFFAVLAIPALGILLPIALQGSRSAASFENSNKISGNANYSAPAVVEEAPSQASPSSSDTPVAPELAAPSPESQPVESPVKTSSPGTKEAEQANVSSKARLSADAVARANARSIGNARAKAGGIQMVVVASERSGAFATRPVVNANRETAPTSASSPTRESSPAKSAPGRTQGRIQTVTAKKESRFGSFIKKTGRILAKPFKR